MSSNWFDDELPYPFSPRDVGWYRVYSFVNLYFVNCTCDYFDRQVTNQFLCCFLAESKRFKPDLRVVHVRDLNFVLRLEIFVHWDGQLQASHLILGVDLVYSTWQAFS